MARQTSLTSARFHEWAASSEVFWRCLVDFTGTPEQLPLDVPEVRSPKVKAEVVVYHSGHYYRLCYASRLDQRWSFVSPMTSYGRVRAEAELDLGDGSPDVTQLIEEWSSILHWDADPSAVVMSKRDDVREPFAVYPYTSPLLAAHAVRMFDQLVHDMVANTNGIDVLPEAVQAEFSRRIQELLHEQCGSLLNDW